MCLEVFCAALPLHRGVAFSPCIIQQHRLIEQLKPLDLLDRSLSSFGLVKDYKSLAFRFEVRLGDNVNDIAVLGENFGEGFL